VTIVCFAESTARLPFFESFAVLAFGYDEAGFFGEVVGDGFGEVGGGEGKDAHGFLVSDLFIMSRLRMAAARRNAALMGAGGGMTVLGGLVR